MAGHKFPDAAPCEEGGSYIANLIDEAFAPYFIQSSSATLDFDNVTADTAAAISGPGTSGGFDTTGGVAHVTVEVSGEVTTDGGATVWVEVWEAILEHGGGLQVEVPLSPGTGPFLISTGVLELTFDPGEVTIVVSERDGAGVSIFHGDESGALGFTTLTVTECL